MASLKRETTAAQSSSVSPVLALEREADMSSTPIAVAPSAAVAASKPIRVRVLGWKNISATDLPTAPGVRERPASKVSAARQ